MKLFLAFLLICSSFPIAERAVQAQEGVASRQALNPGALPMRIRRDVITNPVQLRHLGFPVKESPFSDPILSEPNPTPQTSASGPQARNPTVAN